MILKEQFFPTTLYAKDLQLDNKLFEEEIFQWMKEDPVGLTKTNMGGWHSQTNLHTRPTFKPLVDEVYKMQREVYEEEWLDREPILGNMWANVNEPGGYIDHTFTLIHYFLDVIMLRLPLIVGSL